jgi:hypothetical protein
VPKTSKAKDQVIPEPFRKMYQDYAYIVWNDIGYDCEEAMRESGEKLTKRAVVEIVQDADRILTRAKEDRERESRRQTQDTSHFERVNKLTDFISWLETSRQTTRFHKDQDRAVRELNLI